MMSMGVTKMIYSQPYPPLPMNSQRTEAKEAAKCTDWRTSAMDRLALTTVTVIAAAVATLSLSPFRGAYR